MRISAFFPVKSKVHRCWKKLTFLLTVTLILLFFACNPSGLKTHSSDRWSDSSVWPHQNSDLSPDTDMVFGRLENGLRYIIKTNQTPRDRVSMHLMVRVGSMYERDDEMGIAHFLEHMLFNGTTHFPPGEMVKYFQRIGMQFGPDANAHTGFDRTVFDVILPKGDRQSLAEGLLVLRDYADGALLLPDEAEREKKVILAEMCSRDSAHFRTFKAAFRFELPGLTLGERCPIGESSTVEKIDYRMLRSFYEAWYRPERMFLFLAGDIEKQAAEQLIEEKFGDLKPMAPHRPLPTTGKMTHDGIKGFYHYEFDAGATTVSIETIEQHPQPLDSRMYQQQQMLRELAIDAMQKRLDDKVRRRQTILTKADFSAGFYLRQFKYAEIKGITDPENWEKAVAELEQTLRKSILYGFTKNEIERAVNEYRARLRRAVEEEGTRDSNSLADEMLDSASQWQVLQSPIQRSELLLPILDRVTPDQVNQKFKEIWSSGHRLVLVTGNAVLASTESPAAEDRIVKIYASSTSVEVKPMTAGRTAAFPYLPPPQSTGKVRHKSEIKDLGITQVLFDNGIQLFLKPTSFKDNQVLAALTFGLGKASEPLDQPGLSKLTEEVVNESGFGGMHPIDLENALAGRMARITFQVSEDKLQVKGMAASKELPLLFQLLYAFVQDPGYLEEARQLALEQLEQKYLELCRSVEGVMKVKGQRFLAGGDVRFGEPEIDQMHNRTLDQIKSWMEYQFRNAPMELALAGDFDVDSTIELAAKYIATLPSTSKEHKISTFKGPVFPKGKELRLNVRCDTQKSLVVVAYPTEDFWDINRTRRLAVLADLFSERLRQNVREKLGASYSPYAFNRPSRAYPGYGMMQINVQVEPQQADVVVKEVLRIADQLRNEALDPDEFRRVQDPILTRIKDLRQENRYWINSVLAGAARHPEQLDWARTFVPDYAAIRAEEVSALAGRYLVADNASTIILIPDSK